jgi:NAD(P)-dependent dehydrogenase (short-subunit alcohol dehydrogenase family)
VRGPYSTIRALRPLLRASGDAVVANVSSISGFTASGSNVAYCAAKAALDNISMSLGRALGPEIRVLSVSPGAVATDFVHGRDRAALESGAKSTPLKRVVEPDDVAAAVLKAAIFSRRHGVGYRSQDDKDQVKVGGVLRAVGRSMHAPAMDARCERGARRQAQRGLRQGQVPPLCSP